MKRRGVISLCGQDGLLISLRQKVSLSANKKVLTLSESIEQLHVEGVEEIIPSYCSVLVRFDPERISFHELREKIELIRRIKMQKNSEERYILNVPVLYGGIVGIDLEEVAKLARVSSEEVIRYHTSTVFHVFSIGFLPGFPYLGIVPRKIRIPRLENPRKCVQKGAVAIANRQSGIYPVESPGGWRIIGQTPFELFAKGENPPTLFRPGDRVRFAEIGPEEFRTIKRHIEKGGWMPFERNWKGDAKCDW
jgi:KipI family sensor histidine kinase inhibitor